MFPGERLGEFLAGTFDGVGCLQERGGSALVAQGRPRRLCSPGGGDCLIQVLKVVDGASPTVSPVAGSGIVRVGPDGTVMDARRAS
jgi:hypothetical protein